MLFGEVQPIKRINVEDESALPNDTSLYMETLNFTIALNEDWFNIRKKMLKLEGHAIVNEDVQLLNEGASDFFGKIKDFFVKILKQIRSLWLKFVNFISSHAGNDKEFIKRYRDTLLSKDVSDFEYTGYFFTIDADIPDPRPETDMILKDVTHSNLSNLTMEKVESQYANIIHDPKHFDQIRGRIIGDAPMSAESYSDELFKVFRNDKNQSDTINVTSDVVQLMITALEKGQDEIKECQKVMKKLDLFYTSIIDYFNNLTKVSHEHPNTHIKVRSHEVNHNEVKFNSGKHESIHSNIQSAEAIRKFASYKSEEARMLSNIYTSAFTAKLDAIKERRKQYRTVLTHILDL